MLTINYIFILQSICCVDVVKQSLNICILEPINILRQIRFQLVEDCFSNCKRFQ